MSIRFSRTFAATCGAVALAAASGTARAESSGMDWLGVVYLWGADIQVDVGDRSVNASFNDIIDKLDMGFMGHVEAQGDTFGGFVDVVYMSVADSRVTGPVSARGELDMTLMDVAMVWSPAPERYTGIEVFGGFRYLGVDFDLSATLTAPPDPTFKTGIDTSYTDILLGGRYAAPINDQWRLVFSGDLSAGDTEGSWSLAGYGVYRNGQHHFFGGYRHLEAELKGNAGRSMEQTFSGPVLGYGFAF